MPRQLISEDDLEQYAISWFKEIGWDYRYGPDIAPVPSRHILAENRGLFGRWPGTSPPTLGVGIGRR
jgi:hypothetical protein